MSTIAETSGTVGSFIDDVASLLTGLSAWSDADTNVTNTGDTDGWRDNGRVLENANTGQYLLMYVLGSGNIFAGVRFVVSNDWDATNSLPAGSTNVHENDRMSGNVGNHRSDSFNNVSSNDHHAMYGVAIKPGNNTGISRDDEMTYFASAQGDYLAAAGWNTADGTYGESGWALYEYVDNKFWSDSHSPFFITSSHVRHGGTDNRYVTAYGWSTIHADQSVDYAQVGNGGGIDDGEWGIVNPDSNDDTFFFRRPVIYETNNNTVPIAYVEDAIKNDLQEGAAHGDTITHDSTTYRAFKQSGASGDQPLSVLLRYE